MTRPPAALLYGLALIGAAQQADAQAISHHGWIRLAQASDAGSNPSPESQASGNQAPGLAPTSSGSPSGPLGTSGTTPAATPSVTALPNAGALPQTTGATRNGRASLPSIPQTATVPGAAGPSSVTFGGPQIDAQPVYGSTMRDSGIGNGGVPIYNSMPGQPGSPINGTANAYYTTSPYGTGSAGLGASRSNAAQSPGNSASYNLQPLGGRAYTRDQNGNLGGRGGYTAQGVYNGTAAQQSGVGYGSSYVQNTRPMGGLLSTGVDASGPLHPYIPLDTSPVGRTNSGYGIPNGSRSTHMDGRGVQRPD